MLLAFVDCQARFRSRAAWAVGIPSVRQKKAVLMRQGLEAWDLRVFLSKRATKVKMREEFPNYLAGRRSIGLDSRNNSIAIIYINELNTN